LNKYEPLTWILEPKLSTFFSRLWNDLISKLQLISDIALSFYYVKLFD